MDDIRRIRVGVAGVGIRGLDQVLADMADAFSDRSDQEVADEMLARLEIHNYIAPSARDEYAAAFVREFRKSLGQPHETESSGGLEVRVVGPGCPRCDQLYERVVKLLTELGLGADLDKITDAKAIAATGVLVTPGLMINGRVVSTGKVPKEKDIRKMIEGA